MLEADLRVEIKLTCHHSGWRITMQPDLTQVRIRNAGLFQGAILIMSVAMPKPVQNDWVKTVLFDRGYLSRIRGEAIKVYLAVIEACGGVPDRSVTISLSLLMRSRDCRVPP